MEVEPTRAGFGRYLVEAMRSSRISGLATVLTVIGIAAIQVSRSCSEILGHASIVTTKRYAGISDDMVRREAGGLEMVTF